MTETPLSRRQALASFATIVLVLSATVAGIPFADGGVRATNVANGVSVGNQSPVGPVATAPFDACRVVDELGTTPSTATSPPTATRSPRGTSASSSPPATSFSMDGGTT